MPAGDKEKQKADARTFNPAAAEIGTEPRPAVVELKKHAKSEAEATKERADKDSKDFRDRWTFYAAMAVAAFNGILVIVGSLGVRAAVRTLRAIEKQADLMERQASEARESNAQQGRDVRASIAEATRASAAMEGIAVSKALNVESVRQSVGISREIADMQKLATELQSRAYLSASLNTAIFQDANHVFEVQAAFRNHGHTPAYDVTFRATAQIVPMPLPQDFSFPLPDETAGASVSLMAPSATKLITRRVSGRVPDNEVDAIKLGGPPPMCCDVGNCELSGRLQGNALH
jgi:hypothetical protein